MGVVCTGHSDGSSRVWDTQSLKKFTMAIKVSSTWWRFIQAVNGVSVGSDGTARIWDLESGRQIVRLVRPVIGTKALTSVPMVDCLLSEAT